MKIIHLSDLHIGRKVHNVSMLPDQRHILSQILEIAAEHRPQAVLIAGDIYDQSVPSADAVALFDFFLNSLSALLSKYGGSIFIISGNHDSPERIAFGGGIMAGSGVYISPVYNGDIKPVVLKDEYGDIAFYMLPFVRLPEFRHALAAAGNEAVKNGDSLAAENNASDNSEDPEIKTYDDAVRAAISRMNINPECRNILITHQFVTGAQRCESEDIISVGGADNVDASVFAPFDYVALGHLHGPQNAGSSKIRYCGTPLKYSFSEKDHIKTVTLLDIGDKKAGKCAEILIKELPLKPLHDMREIRGKYSDIMLRENYENTDTNDYVRIILTDENFIPYGMPLLRTVYPNAMLLDYDNERTKNNAEMKSAENARGKSNMDLLDELYKMINGKEMSKEQREFASEIFEEISGNQKEVK